MPINIRRSPNFVGFNTIKSTGAGGGINTRLAGSPSAIDVIAAIDPGSLPNLSAWYKADALAFSNGATVTSWTDSSANGNTLNLLTGTPIYNSSDVQFNNKPTVTFNGSSHLRRSNPTAFPVGSGPNISIYVVGYANDISTNCSFGGFGGNATRNRIAIVSNQTDSPDRYYVEYCNAITDVFLTPSATPVIISYRLPAGYNISESNFYVNNTLSKSSVVADGSLTISNPPQEMAIGVGPSVSAFGNFLQGKVAEYIVYNGYHDDVTRAGVTQYLSDKYGISIASEANQITSEGLILNYDIGNTVSYPGSGTTVTDLRNNSAASLLNSPTYSSGYLTFNGTNQALKTDTNLSSLFLGTSPNKSEVTSLFMWVYPISAGNILVEKGASSVADDTWRDSNIEIDSSGNFSFGVWNGSILMNDKVVSTAQSFNAWYYVGWTYNGSTLTAYINGASVGSVALNRAAPYNNSYGLYYTIAASCSTNMGTDSYCNMRLGAFQVYNTSLTAAQVLKNYNVTKATYGL